MARWAIVVLLLIVIVVPAVCLVSSFDSHDHAALKHARSARGGWRNVTLAPRIEDALSAPARTWWSLSTESPGAAVAVSSAPFVPPRTR